MMEKPYWQKCGILFSPDEDSTIMGFTHASNPLAIHKTGNIYQVLYSTRDQQNKSSVAVIEIDILEKVVIPGSNRLLIQHGSSESFYSHGISLGNYWKKDDEIYVGFMGWHNKPNEHWTGEIGSINLNKLLIDKILAKTEEDPISLSYPFVIQENGIYKMWYGSTIRWETEDKEMLHVIKYATSKDMKTWDYHGQVIEDIPGLEQAFSKPMVFKMKDQYHMWYSYRGEYGTSYKIGHSTSLNGINWKRGKLDLLPSFKSGEWDSEMTCYPYLFSHNETIYMLYNGNRYGKTGFGLAYLHI